jgi:hypothetical protein
MPSWPFSKDASSDWKIDTLPIPWDARRLSIYDHILRHIESGRDRLREGGDTLPDEEIQSAGRELRFAPGAFDGAFGHHVSGAQQELRVDEAFDLLRRALRTPTAVNLQALYDLCCGEDLLGLLDPLIRRIVESSGPGTIPADRLFELANLLALQAPDRGPVKFAIAMLGLFKAGGSGDVVMTLGRHEEFTLFSAVAISNQSDDPELQLWKLAKGVNGWGRIHCVERLKGTKHPAIKAWLLREGFRNSVMYEYLAHIAADTGGLAEELRMENPDGALLAGAGDMLAAMASGQPGPGMAGYTASAEAAELYLKHMDARAGTIEDLRAIIALRSYAGHDDDWDQLAEQGWSAERRQALVANAGRIVAQPKWRTLIADGLEGDDDRRFWQARNAAERLGIDTWDASFRRQERGQGDHWFELMRANEPERIDRVLGLAEGILPLDDIATGPRMELLGVGPAFRHHGALGFIVQGLRRFPDKGWVFVRSALRSPVIRNRNMAIQALAKWGIPRWPDEAHSYIADALKSEPDEKVRARLERLVKGEPIDGLDRR